MILFQKIRYKNFLSTGNNFTEIDLLRSKTTLVVGTNGAGKSTVLDALSFGLFGKPHRSITKPQLVNSVNGKQCVVEVEFMVGAAQFKIVRGIKPGIFEIWKNGEMINQSSHAKEYQRILETNILKINHKSFHQVVVLGSSSFIPFMQLNPHNRRLVIEELLDIGVFSKMNQILKEEINVIKDSLREFSYNIDLTKNKVDTQKKYIADVSTLTEENRRNYEHRIHESQNSIDELQAKNSELSLGLEESIRVAEEGLSALHDKRQALMLGGQDRQTNLSNVRKRIKFFEENETCSVCDQAISDSHKHDILETAKQEANGIQSECRKIGAEGTTVEKEISDTGSVLGSLRSKVSELGENNLQISAFQKQIQEYNLHLEKDVGADLKKANADLLEIKNELSNLQDKKISINDSYTYKLAIGEMLKDTGIKTKIIKQYLPVMNQLINQYLQILDFYVHFDLDEEFHETIRSRHRDEFSYDSFSEGEKQRIDLALLFTWRQIAKMKNSVSTNLLILDETFDSSLDDAGIENLLKILYTLDDNTNVFIISHKGEILDGKFDSKIEFKKEKNFSQMAA
jgi:DNA repair exonuclease SbcCD ATPase subunit